MPETAALSLLSVSTGETAIDSIQLLQTTNNVVNRFLVCLSIYEYAAQTILLT